MASLDNPDKPKQPSTPVEKVSAEPGPIRNVAMELALLRAPVAPATPADVRAIQQYVQATFRSTSKRMPERNTAAGAFNSNQLARLWEDGERIVEQAKEVVRNRTGRAWARELSRRGRARPWRINLNIADAVIFPAMEKGDLANARILQILNTPAANIVHGATHRNRIIDGVARYVEYMKFARQTVQDENAVRQLIIDWSDPARVAAGDMSDTVQVTDQDISRVEVLDRGQQKFSKLSRDVQDLLTPNEKVVYVEYLGAYIGSKARRVSDDKRIVPILAKIRQNEAVKAERVKRRGEAAVAPETLAILRTGFPPEIPPLTQPEQDWYVRYRGSRLRSPEPPAGSTRTLILGKVEAIHRERIRRAGGAVVEETESPTERFRRMDLQQLERIALSSREMRNFTVEEIDALEAAINRKREGGAQS